jgi:hypothetical protein
MHSLPSKPTRESLIVQVATKKEVHNSRAALNCGKFRSAAQSGESENQQNRIARRVD